MQDSAEGSGGDEDDLDYDDDDGALSNYQPDIGMAAKA